MLAYSLFAAAIFLWAMGILFGNAARFGLHDRQSAWTIHKIHWAIGILFLLYLYLAISAWVFL